ncbi:hypothetical protein ACFWVM_29080 [Nocardia fluminea]|uniref:hypothetical protein n=1 Tax=Nocardia fluminea TaxID=134984 RepID=UPI0036619A52
MGSSISARGTLAVDQIVDELHQEHVDRAAKAKAVGCPTFTKPGPNGELGMWVCAHDPGEMTEQEAHLAMQVHIDCEHWACAVRRRGRTTLVDSRAMVLDAQRAPR